MRLSFRDARWRLRLPAGEGAVVTATISTDARLAVLHVSDGLRPALRHKRRALSLQVAESGSPQEVDFTASCASRISFAFSGGNVLLGSRAAPEPSFDLSRPPTTGIAGDIIMGPTCPVVRPGCPPDRSVRGTVHIDTAPATRSSGPSTPVTTVSSDSNGHFAADLPPGNYLVYADPATPLPPTPSGSSTSRAATVRVERGVISVVTLVFDTGIR